MDEVMNKFRELLIANPGLRIIHFVHHEVVEDNRGGYWAALITDCEIDDYVVLQIDNDMSEIHLRGDMDEVVRIMHETIKHERPGLSEEEYNELAVEMANNLPWEKAIIVYLGINK